MKDLSLRIFPFAPIALLLAFVTSASATTPQQYAPATLTASMSAMAISLSWAPTPPLSGVGADY